MRQILVGVSASLLLFLVACGDSEDSGGDGGGDGGGQSADEERESTTTTDGDAAGSTADEYVETLSSGMSAGEGATFDQETAACLATGIVDLIGVDALIEADVSPDELANAQSLDGLGVEAPDDAAERLGAAFDECGVGGRLATTLAAGATAEAGSQVSADVGTCIEDNMDHRALAEALARSFLDASDQDFQTVMGDAFAACPQALKALILSQTPGEVTAEVEACVDSIIEENRELVEEAVAYNDEGASEELALLLEDTCPAVIGTGGQ